MKKNSVWLLMLLLVCFKGFSQSSLPVWATTYNVGAPLVQYTLFDFSVDSAGNSYVLCLLQDTSMWNSNIRCGLLKYNSNGQLLWADTIMATQYLGKVKVSKNGNIYVGTSQLNGNSYDFLIRKLDSSGNRIWTKNYGTIQSYIGGRLNGMALDDSENIYLAGQTGQLDDAVMMKCDSAGSVLWNTTYFHLPNRYDRAHAIDYDSQGNSYVVVMSQDTNNYPDVIVLKYSVLGQLIWQQQYGGTSYDFPKFLKVFNDTSIYVGGDYGTGNASDYMFLNYSSTGQFRWARIFDPQNYYNYPGNLTDQTKDMLVTHSGNVILTGNCFWGSGATRRINVAYDPLGNLLWVRRDFRAAEGHSIVEDRSGHIIFSGLALDTVSNAVYGVGLSKYDSLGTCVWSSIYVSSLSEFYYGSRVGVDYIGNIYCSSEKQNYPNNEMTTLKFDYTLSVNEFENIDREIAVFPNPFSSSVRFTMKDERIQRFLFYDVTGNLLYNKSDIYSNSFELERGTFVDGIYFYRIELEDGKFISGKVLVQK